MLKFLIDESSGGKLYRALLENNYDTEFVSEIMPGAPDFEVLNYAEKNSRILKSNFIVITEGQVRIRKI